MYANKVKEIFKNSILNHSYKKAVYSKPDDNSIKRMEAALFSCREEVNVQLAFYYADGKVRHENIPVNQAEDRLTAECVSFGQCNIITSCGEAMIRRNKNNALVVIDKIKRTGSDIKPSIPSHNAQKDYILQPGTYVPFMHELGISDSNGRIYDKKTEKFRQINRFLEIFADAMGNAHLSDGITVADLCCGKSYLTFAVHHYLTVVKGLDAHVTGIDRKGNMMTLCSNIAKCHSIYGLSFIEGDIEDYKPERVPNVVISLHACDIATDIVLTGAVRWGSKVILSSPCCQHELYSKMKGSPLPPLTDYPLIKQRMCELATDSLRGKALEIAGYDVDMVEFTGLEDTPKNLMIRAVKRSKPLSQDKIDALMKEFKSTCEMLGIVPSIGKMIGI